MSSKRLAWGFMLIGWMLVPFASVGAASLPASATEKPPVSLLKAWLAYPQLDGVAWPYAYIRAHSTNSTLRQERADLFKEFSRLKDRLRAAGYPKLVATVGAWKRRLAQTRGYRVPGNWSPASLMSHPNQNPPINRIQAIGSCKVPDWVQVWDSNGVRNVAWRPGIRLSHLLKIAPALRDDKTGEVAVVTPEGHIDHYGIAAWNYADTALVPGTRVVAGLPLKGQAFSWIRDTIASLLAHTPSGVHCRGVQLSRSGDRG